LSSAKKGRIRNAWYSSDFWRVTSLLELLIKHRNGNKKYESYRQEVSAGGGQNVEDGAGRGAPGRFDDD
jgi:hypothetical protein